MRQSVLAFAIPFGVRVSLVTIVSVTFVGTSIWRYLVALFQSAIQVHLSICSAKSLTTKSVYIINVKCDTRQPVTLIERPCIECDQDIPGVDVLHLDTNLACYPKAICLGQELVLSLPAHVVREYCNNNPQRRIRAKVTDFEGKVYRSKWLKIEDIPICEE